MPAQIFRHVIITVGYVLK